MRSDQDKVKKLLLKYRDIINELRQLGVIRTGKVVSDYGEFMAAKLLGLELVASSSNKGFDATDKKGVKYEIKSRKATSWNKPTIFPVKQEQLETANFLIYVEFDDSWNLVKLLKLPCKEVKSNKYNRVILTKDLVSKYTILPNSPPVS